MPKEGWYLYIRCEKCAQTQVLFTHSNTGVINIHTHTRTHTQTHTHTHTHTHRETCTQTHKCHTERPFIPTTCGLVRSCLVTQSLQVLSPSLSLSFSLF